MTDEKNLASAKNVYSTLCSAIEAREWKYDKKEDDLLVHFVVSGDDIPMNFIMVIDADRQLIRLMSSLPFKFSENNRMLGAIATCVATYGLVDGSFDYNINDGSVSFRMTASFRESLIGVNLLQYMISLSCSAVDKYNDKFLALEKGLITIEAFIECE